MTQESPANDKNVKTQPNDQIVCNKRDHQNEIDDSPGGNSSTNDHVSVDNRAELQAVKYVDV